MIQEHRSETGIYALLIVKNEWPILGLSISHALLNYAEKVIVIDTGSTDATLAGLESLEQIWPGRIIVYKHSPSKFDQASLLNILLVIAEELGSTWNVILDADEFLYTSDYSIFKQALATTGADYLGYSIPVKNFAVSENFHEYELASYLSIQAKLVQRNAASMPWIELVKACANRNALPQTVATPDKLILKTSHNTFGTQGNHQLVFGDGKNWEKWDSKVASGTRFSGEIFHLPYTSQRRFGNRTARAFFDGVPRLWEVYVKETGEDASSFFNRSIVETKDIPELVDKGLITLDYGFKDLIASTILHLQNKDINLEQISKTKPSGELAHESLDLEIVSKIVRKFYDKAFDYWTKPSAH
jgi:glycosyltransferase involved in cell wall biosynthesis